MKRDMENNNSSCLSMGDVESLWKGYRLAFVHENCSAIGLARHIALSVASIKVLDRPTHYLCFSASIHGTRILHVQRTETNVESSF